MSSKRIYAIIIFLPLVALAAWSLAEQVLVWTYASPRWVLSQNNIGAYIACTQLAEVALPGAEPVEQPPANALNRARVQRSVELFFKHRYGFAPLSLVSEPALVNATFPDGQPRLAWRALVMTDVGGFAQSDGHASVLFMDGYNGAPLLLVDRAYVGDPCMTCGCLTTNLPLTPNQLWAGGLSLVWALGVGLVVGGGVVVKRVKRK